MQHISAEPLVQKFKNGTFQQSEIGPYFMAYMILSAAVWIFSYRDATAWDILGTLASVVITFFGVLHLKEQNLDTFLRVSIFVLAGSFLFVCCSFRF